MNKKGGFTDIFVFIVIAFVLMVAIGIFVYVGSTSYGAVRDKFIETPDAFPNTNATQVAEETLGQIPVAYSVLYWGSIILIIGMIMSIFIGSYLVTTKPIFFVPYIILSFIAVIVSMPMANVYEQIIQDPTLAESFSHFVGSNFLLLNLPIISAVVAIIGGIIMFASWRVSRNENQIFIAG